MATWAEVNGLEGISDFFYIHSDEERMHMLKLVRFVNERGGKANISSIDKPQQNFKSIQDVFEIVLAHEVTVSESINKIVSLALNENDHASNNFMQWYVSEQVEEEKLVRTILDKLKLIGNDKAGLYLFDRDISKLHAANI
jgi:ferritin